MVIRCFILLLLLSVAACTTDREKRLKIALERANMNRGELEKVINHYAHDSEKQEAACFLIANMLGKQVVDSTSIPKSNLYYKAFSAYRKEHDFYENEIQYEICDSLKKLYPEVKSDLRYLSDLQEVSADFLIQHIDRCFRLREQYAWCKTLDKETFYKYVLPYTANNCYWEGSIPFFTERYATLRDTIPDKSYRKVGEAISATVEKSFKQKWELFSWREKDLLPTTFKNLADGQIGTCLEKCVYEIAALRANGVPAVLNTFPSWGNFDSPHYWVEIPGEKRAKQLYDNTPRMYYLPEDNMINSMFWLDKYSPYLKDIPPHIEFQPCRTVSKVYRVNYELQPKSLALQAEELIPAFFKNPGIEDVTDKYMVCQDIQVELWEKEHPSRYIYLCCYSDGKWLPVSWSRPKGQRAKFAKMSVNMLYLPAYYLNGIVVPAGEPFILQADGKQRRLTPQIDSPIEAATLYSKTPYRLHTAIRACGMVGARFALCNRADQTDSLSVFTIRQLPIYRDSFQVESTEMYRYLVCDFRHTSPEVVQFTVAELEVYGTDGRLLKGVASGTRGISEYQLPNLSDGDRLSYYLADQLAPQQSFVIDFGSPQAIEKVVYYPRSDDNGVVNGELYELYYWDKEWISLGQQYGKENRLVYPQVPDRALFRLHNHTRGKEHRPFTYDAGKQVWW